jgi:hypothetical protein
VLVVATYKENSMKALTLAFLALTPSLAFAQLGSPVHVDIHFDDTSLLTFTYAANAAINNLPSIGDTVDRINIYAVPNTTNIGRVTLAGTATSDIHVILGTSSWNGTNFAHATACGDWAGLSASGTFRNWLHLEGKIGADLSNSVQVGHLYRFDVAGTINNSIDVNAGSTTAAGFYHIECGAVGASGSLLAASNGIAEVGVAGDMSGTIHASGGNVGLVTIGDDLIGGIEASATDAEVVTVNVADDMTGTIRANTGRLGDITVIGTVDAPDDLIGNAIRSKNGLNSLVAGDITSATGIGLTAGAGLGELGLLKTTSGNFAGTVTCKSLVNSGGAESGIIINGDVSELIHISSGGTLSYPIWIGGSLTSGGTIDYDAASSLTNQIIINRTAGSGTWSGAVTIGSTTLSGPYYTNLSSTLGGGAVGLAPFHLHDEDCVPANGSTQAIGMMTTIALRHYGPVQWTSGDPVEVYWRLNGSSGPWNVLDPADWTATAGADPRDVIVDTVNNFDFDALFDYKIVPSSNLKCKDVTGNPAVGAWEYYLFGN